MHRQLSVFRLEALLGILSSEFLILNSQSALVTAKVGGELLARNRDRCRRLSTRQAALEKRLDIQLRKHHRSLIQSLIQFANLGHLSKCQALSSNRFS